MIRHIVRVGIQLFFTVRIDLCLHFQLKVQMHIRNLDYYFLKIHFLIEREIGTAVSIIFDAYPES